MCPEIENKNILLVYDCELTKAVSEASAKRSEGFSVVMLKKTESEDTYKAFADNNNFAKVLFI